MAFCVGVVGTDTGRSTRTNKGRTYTNYVPVESAQPPEDRARRPSARSATSRPDRTENRTENGSRSRASSKTLWLDKPIPRVVTKKRPSY